LNVVGSSPTLHPPKKKVLSSYAGHFLFIETLILTERENFGSNHGIVLYKFVSLQNIISFNFRKCFSTTDCTDYTDF
ncbi:MAG: hypothetical protein IJR84_09370, partial [Bacteroidaceae bacterium]|nr:hypothetical protein [Bacteroidaceae bacterium]